MCYRAWREERAREIRREDQIRDPFVTDPAPERPEPVMEDPEPAPQPAESEREKEPVGA